MKGNEFDMKGVSIIDGIENIKAVINAKENTRRAYNIFQIKGSHKNRYKCYLIPSPGDGPSKPHCPGNTRYD